MTFNRAQVLRTTETVDNVPAGTRVTVVKVSPDDLVVRVTDKNNALHGTKFTVAVTAVSTTSRGRPKKA
jgi:hypothetical protein